MGYLGVVFLALLQAPSPVDSAIVREIYQTRNFTHGRPNAFQWSPDGGRLYFLRTPPDGQGAALYSMKVTATGVEAPVELASGTTLLKGEEENLSPEEKARRERMRVMAKGLASFQLSPDGKKVLVPYSGKLFLIDSEIGKPVIVPLKKTPVLDAKFSPDSNRISFVRDHNLFVFEIPTGKEIALTEGGTADKPFGEAEFVAQEEMARFTGYWWSPDSKRVLCQETDQSMVETWTLSDPAAPGGSPQTWRYPRPGRANAAVGLRVISLAKIVMDAFRFFENQRYQLFAWCIMPNHVHVVLEPKEGHHLSDILKSWKTFTAKKANLILNRTGAFWQAESFDRMIRNQQELGRALEYVRNNPIKAGLMDWPWVWVRSPELPV